MKKTRITRIAKITRITTIMVSLILIITLGLSACSVVANNPASRANFTFGPSANQPETIDEFLPLFAEQVKRYNEIALELWPNNEVANIKVVIDNIDTGKLWFVDSDGTLTPMTEDEANELGVDRLDRPDDWRFFAPESSDEAAELPATDESSDLTDSDVSTGTDIATREDDSDVLSDSDIAASEDDSNVFSGTDIATSEDDTEVSSDSEGSGISGTYYSYTDTNVAFKDGYLYFSVSEKSLSERDKWGRYPHVNIYSVLKSLVHESYHAYEQTKWEEQAIPVNMEGDLALGEVEAREKRDLLTRQLMEAVNNPDDETLILEALATYQDYKTNFKDDYEKAIFWDRQEGTAQYLEVMLSLIINFPEQIMNKDDLEQALTQLATEEIYHQDAGIVGEAYDIGIFAGILLDRLDIDWKEPLMSDPYATPLEMLFRHFENETLPEPEQVTTEDSQAVAQQINLKKEDIRNALQYTIDVYEKEWETADDARRAELEELIEFVENQIEERTN